MSANKWGNINLNISGVSRSGKAVSAVAKATPKSPAKTMLQKAASLTRKAGSWLKKHAQKAHNRVLGGRVIEGQGGIPYGVVNRTRFGRGINMLKSGFGALGSFATRKARNAHNYVLGGRKVLKGSIPRKRLGRFVNMIKGLFSRKRGKQNVHNIAPPVSKSAQKRLNNFLGRPNSVRRLGASV